MERLALDRDAFAGLLRQSFGDRATQDNVDILRERILSSDRSWVPDVQFVPRAQLRGGEAAYDGVGGRILVSDDLQTRPQALRRAYTEELGHHLDRLLGPGDTAGDEGEIFARLLAGEVIRPAELGELRRENDHGRVQLDEQTIQVEFFLGEAFGKIGSAIKKGVGQVTDLVDKGVDAVSGAADKVLRPVRGLLVPVLTPVAKLLGRVAPFLAWVPGLGGPILTAYYGMSAALSLLGGKTSQVLRSIVPAALSWGLSSFLGETAVGRWSGDVASGLARTARGIAGDVLDVALQAPGSLLRHGVNAVGSMVRGDPSGAWRELSGIVLEPVERTLGFGVNVAARLLRGTADLAGKLLGVAPIARNLLPGEIERYGAFFGSSIDLTSARIQRDPIGALFGMRAHVVGNTIYLPADSYGGTLFGPSGGLTTAGWDTLDHEIAHVWQNQTIGGRYLYEALFAQARASLGLGDGSAARESGVAYWWRHAIQSGLTLAELNPEAQAEVIREMLQKDFDLGAMTDFVSREMEALGGA